MTCPEENGMLRKNLNLEGDRIWLIILIITYKCLLFSSKNMEMDFHFGRKLEWPFFLQKLKKPSFSSN